MRKLQGTVGREDGFRPIMACHHSQPGAETACIGYVAVEGWRNLNVRVLAMRGRIDLPGIQAATEGLDLWESFEAMLAAFEAALAAGE